MPEYDYEYTELDGMPEGWRIAFGEKLCDELLEELVANDFLDRYMITDIKEKFGSLRWYDNLNTKHGYEILGKYCALSKRTCIRCGKPATRISSGWISPFCDDCIGEEESWPIEEYFAEVEGD